MALNTLESDNLLRQIAYLKERIAKLESYFQGTPIPSVKIEDGSITNAKIADATITNAKIASLSASKITAGTLHEQTILGDDSDIDNLVIIDGEETRIVIKIDGTEQILIGKQVGGF